jgi:methylated-DNA-[protein]-cysteine S-methyltransferase
MKITPFQDKVFSYLKNKIPKGKVTTYGGLAKALKTSPRAVGQALKRNPNAPIVPCHRVVSADGSIGGFNGKIRGKEVERKRKLLESEGIKFQDGRIDRKQIIP